MEVISRLLDQSGLSLYTLGLALAVCLVVLVAIRVVSKTKKLPPGPWGLPWLGSVPYLVLGEYFGGREKHELLAELADKHGKVFSLTVFGQLVLVLSDPEAVKEAFSRQDFNDRPEIDIEHIPTGTGVALASGMRWKQQRAFTISTLDRLVGRQTYEDKIATETEVLLDEMAKKEDLEFDPKYLLMVCVSNIITQLLFHTRHDYNDADYKTYLDRVAEVTHLMGSSGAAQSIPLIGRLPIPSRIRLSRLLVAEFEDIRRMIETHRDVLDRGNLRDYVDEYLNEIVKQREQGDSSEINEANLPETLVQLYSAGTENVATTLRWALLYMIWKPDMQARVQAELDGVVGRERLPSLADEPALPFTRATLLEIQRLASVTPTGVAHASSKPSTYRGWTIPAGTVVISNTWAIHYDPKLWVDPEEFNPERFIGEGNKIINEDRLLPFSAGNRVCIGRHLARTELFIVFTHLLHRFSFRKAGGATISLQGHGSFARVPGDYILRVAQRR